mmetsp:Transcript_5464/g.8832  ORF Transcript_5464/g.8832 Transcript_5464/m.8832 type:complete len:304 (+) Transcript_5464:1659-2570(+)
MKALIWAGVNLSSHCYLHCCRHNLRMVLPVSLLLLAVALPLLLPHPSRLHPHRLEDMLPLLLQKNCFPLPLHPWQRHARSTEPRDPSSPAAHVGAKTSKSEPRLHPCRYCLHSSAGNLAAATSRRHLPPLLLPLPSPHQKPALPLALARASPVRLCLMLILEKTLQQQSAAAELLPWQGVCCGPALTGGWARASPARRPLPTLRSLRPHRGTSPRMAAPTQSPRWPGENSSVAVPQHPKSAATRWRPRRQARVACAPLRSSARYLVRDKARVDPAHLSRFVAAKGVSLEGLEPRAWKIAPTLP